jgi:hypothetical protein
MLAVWLDEKENDLSVEIQLFGLVLIVKDSIST